MNDDEARRETDGEKLARMGTDASLWAAEMAAVLARDPDALDPAPGAMLHGWLCAAIETGRSAGYSAAQREHNPNWPLPGGPVELRAKLNHAWHTADLVREQRDALAARPFTSTVKTPDVPCGDGRCYCGGCVL